MRKKAALRGKEGGKCQCSCLTSNDFHDLCLDMGGHFRIRSITYIDKRLPTRLNAMDKEGGLRV